MTDDAPPMIVEAAAVTVGTDAISEAQSRVGLPRQISSVGVNSKGFPRCSVLRSISKLTSEITQFRPAEVKDIPAIMDLEHEETQEFFGPVNYEDLLEYSMYQRVLEDPQGHIVAFISFTFFPNIRALSPSTWLDWIKHHYSLEAVTYTNTVFIEYLVMDFLCFPLMFMQIFEDIFMKYPKLRYIMVVAPPRELAGVYDNLFNIYCTKNVPKMFKGHVTMHPNTQCIFICDRSMVITKLRCRKALAADNDALVHIFDEKHPYLRKELGDYYIAEQILGEHVDKKIVVMEKNENQMGALMMSTNIDFEYLYKNFELSSYNQLKGIQAVGAGKVTVNDIVRKNSEEFFRSVTTSEINNNLLEDSVLLEPDLEEQFHSYDSVNKVFENLHDEYSSPEEETPLVRFKWDLISDKYDQPNVYEEIVTKELKIQTKMTNVFAIEVFGINEKMVDRRRIYELLEAAFATFPDKDYCIVVVDHNDSSDTIFRYFSRVPPKPQCESHKSLYISHKNVILSDISVTAVTYDDLMHLQILLDSNYEHKFIRQSYVTMNYIWHSLTNQHKIYDTICIRSNNNLIGLVILCKEDRIKSFQKYFEIGEIANFLLLQDESYHGKILYFYLHPLFDSESPTIFREITRLTGYYNFYYTIEKKWKIISLYNNLLPEMFPILPSPYFTPYNHNYVPDSETPMNITNYFKPSPLYFQSLRLSQNIRQNIDLKIVAIGYDYVCKGFLTKLIFGPDSRYYKFTNITVICRPGVVDAETSNYYNKIYKLFNWRIQFGPVFMKRLHLRTWVNFIGVNVQSIDRDRKCIVLENKDFVKYDKLFLVSSISYGSPSDIPREKNITPVNYVLVNNFFDGILFYHKLKILKQLYPDGFNILIYGNTLYLYACLNFLMDQQIAGKNIHFVMQNIIRKDEINVGAFDDTGIEDQVMNTLTIAGVHIYRDFRFVRWSLDESNLIKNITFESKFTVISLTCKLFICYNRKSMLRPLRTIYKQAGLVIDGRLVIDENYKLNDPDIYAAGPITQYKRLLYASKYDHLPFCKYEVGESLADKFLTQLGIISSKFEHSAFQIPILTAPSFNQVMLPGGLLYVQIRKPGPRVPRHISRILTGCGTNLITGDQFRYKANTFQFTSKKGNITRSNRFSEYFRIRLTDQGGINSMICLTQRTSQPLNFLLRIFQAHEKLLNSMRRRYKLGMISDFLEYFSRPWANVLFTNQFNEFRKQNLDFILGYLQTDPFSGNLIQNHLSGQTYVLTENDRKSLKNTLSQKQVVRTLERKLIEYINQSNDLVVYKNCNLNELAHYFEETK